MRQRGSDLTGLLVLVLCYAKQKLGKPAITLIPTFTAITRVQIRRGRHNINYLQEIRGGSPPREMGFDLFQGFAFGLGQQEDRNEEIDHREGRRGRTSTNSRVC